MPLDRTLVRFRNLSAQVPQRYILMPGSVEQGAIYVHDYAITDGIVYGYETAADMDAHRAGIAAPVASGFLVLPAASVVLETLEQVMRRAHADGVSAEELEKELSDKHPRKGSTRKILPFRRPGDDDPDGDSPPAAPVGTGQYL